MLSRGFLVLGLMALVLSLSACGFQLKGYSTAGKAHFNSIKIIETTGVRADFLQVFIQTLQSSGVQIVDTLEQAELVIEFKPTLYQTSQMDLSGVGNVTFEHIRMSQSFLVEEVATEKKLLEATVVSLRDRQIDLDYTAVSDRELQSIQQQMSVDLALKVVDRINRAWLKQQEVTVP